MPRFYASMARPRATVGGCGKTRRLIKKVQMRGGARQSHARRTACTLSVRPRAPTKQMGLFQQPAPGDGPRSNSHGMPAPYRFSGVLSVNDADTTRIYTLALHDAF